jgi:hypothetical protein
MKILAPLIQMITWECMGTIRYVFRRNKHGNLNVYRIKAAREVFVSVYLMTIFNLQISSVRWDQIAIMYCPLEAAKNQTYPAPGIRVELWLKLWQVSITKDAAPFYFEMGTLWIQLCSYPLLAVQQSTLPFFFLKDTGFESWLGDQLSFT